MDCTANDENMEDFSVLNITLYFVLIPSSLVFPGFPRVNAQCGDCGACTECQGQFSSN